MALNMHNEALRASLQKAKLLPGPASEFIAEDFEPKTVLNVRMDEANVLMGNFFRVSEVQNVPKLEFEPEEGVHEGTTYLAMLIDPDAPTPEDPKYAFWRHWIQGGILPGDWPPYQPAVTRYLAPGPKDEYLFLLFREPADVYYLEEDVGGEEFTQRRSFKASEFIKQKGLTLVGVNWMTCAGDGWKQ